MVIDLILLRLGGFDFWKILCYFSFLATARGTVRIAPKKTNWKATPDPSDVHRRCQRERRCFPVIVVESELGIISI